MAKNYYQILGVNRTASDEEIKKAFRRLAHQHHPDKAGGDETRFKEINEAYQVLSDAKKRAQYDQFGTADGGPGPQWGDFNRAGFGFGSTADFGDLSDIFGDIFGFGGATRPTRHQGSDARVDLSIDFAESVAGAEKKLEMTGLRVCDECNGSGAEPGTLLVACSTCRGRGVTERLQQTILGDFRAEVTCADCQGSGQRPKTNCKHCRGTGSRRGKQQVEVVIPAGIADGQSIRLRRQGEPGPRGGEPGDLYVRIRVRPDPMFRRDGDDIFTRRTVSISTATLGGSVEVQTVDGPVTLAVPTGTQPGKIFRLKGKGVPHLGGGSRGDQLVEIVVRVPERLTKEQRKIMESFAGTENRSK